MAKSKRAQVVPLTVVKKKVGKEVKEQAVDKIRENVQSSEKVYVIELSHCKTRHLQLFREQLKEQNLGVIVMTKNRLVQVALGVDKQSSLEENIYKISGLFEGQVSLLCLRKASTTEKQLTALFEAAQEKFVEESDSKGKDYSEALPAHAGDIATETVVIPEGEVPGVAFSIEPLLRKLGMPTRLDNSKIYVLGDYTVCTEGEPLTKDAAHLLKLLGRYQAKPELRFKGCYDKTKHAVKIFRS